MKPSTPKPGERPAPAAGDTQVIDLQDVEVLVAAHAQEEREHERSLPPPLPPEVRASHVPSEPPRASQPPGSQAPSFHPPAPAPPPAPPRSNAFYAVALLGFLVIGIGGGLLVAMTLRKAPAPTAAATPSGAPQAAVITIPTVEVDDDPDGGNGK